MTTGLLRFGGQRLFAIISLLFVTFFIVLLSLQHQEVNPPTLHHYNGLSLRLVSYFKRAICEQVEELCCNLKTVLRLDQFKNWEERWKMNTRPSPKIEGIFPNHRWTLSALLTRWSLATASCGTQLETSFWDNQATRFPPQVGDVVAIFVEVQPYNWVI